MPLVFIPALLREFTGGRESVEVAGSTVREAVENLEAACPGIRDRLLEGDRLRPNIRVAVDGAISAMGLRERVSPESEIQFVAAIGGGAAARRCGAGWSPLVTCGGLVPAPARS